MITLFGIFPYIKTEEPFSVAGVSIRNNNDTNGLSNEEIQDLKSILALFYLKEDEPIIDLSYTIVRSPDDTAKLTEKIVQLKAAHAILTYLLTVDDYGSLEQTMLYLLKPGDIWGEKSLEKGFFCNVNWLYKIQIPLGKKIFPPQPYPYGFYPRYASLSRTSEVFRMNREKYYGLERFLEGEILIKSNQVDRYNEIIQAMSWYNRSFSVFISEEEKLVDIDIALEILFHNQEFSKSKGIPITEELKEHFRGLFGDINGLNNWIDQFYKARSKILHEGHSEKMVYSSGRKKTGDDQLVMSPLINYGRKLLRLSILNILYGTVLVEECNLNSWFTHDKERIEEICRLLRQKDIPAIDRLNSILPISSDLSENYMDEIQQNSIKIEAIISTGKLLIETHLEAYPDIAADIKTELEEILNNPNKNPIEILDKYGLLENNLRRGVGSYNGKLWPTKPWHALAYFAKYASSPTFPLRIYFQERRANQ